MEVDIKNMTRADMDTAVEWAAMEGWNPGLGDAERFFNTDPDGFFMAFIGDKPVGCVSAVSYGAAYGFIGFFIVLPGYRGHRIGVELGSLAVATLEDRNIGIDGVEEKAKQYGNYGFKFAYNNIRFEGAVKEVYPVKEDIEALSELRFPDIVEYDSKFFPCRRERFLSRWVVHNGGASYALVYDSKISGYGVIRPCRKGFKIGPLFANDPLSAEKIFRSLLSGLEPGQVFYLDVPEGNRAALALADRYGMKKIFQTARMYNRSIPNLPIDGIFGVTSFELG